MIPFTKMQGIGNDFVILDTLKDRILLSDLPKLAIRMNNRRFGVGGDGLILIEKGLSSPFKMRMFNPDGSESEMCGNGVRCFAKLLRSHGHISGADVDVETGAGTLHLRLTPEGEVEVDMGFARLTRTEVGMQPGGDGPFIDQKFGAYQATAVSMGNPHVVIFVDDVQAVEIERVGPELEHHPWFPSRTNVHFVQVVSRVHLLQRTWERGAGITLACGTGACAVCVAAFLTKRAERSVQIDLPGGRLRINYLENGHVLMTGPAETVFTGEFCGSEDDSSETDLDLAGVFEAESLEHV